MYASNEHEHEHERNFIGEFKGKASNKIMAVRFSNTELFETPISLRTIHEILDTKAQFQSPRFISSEKFFQIYSIGCSKSV